jgi:hypothetical protein
MAYRYENRVREEEQNGVYSNDDYWNDETPEQDDSFSDWSDCDCEEENDYEDNYEVNWPGTRVALPPISFLIKHHAPIATRPEPADPALKERYDTHMVELTAIQKKKKEIKKSLDEKSGELLKAEAQPVTYSSKWSDKAKGSGRDALIKRLEGELAVIQKEFDQICIQLAKVERSNKALVDYINAVKRNTDMFEEGVKKEREGWFKLYGHHTPIKSLAQLKRYYEILSVTPSKDAGYILIKFADDMKVNQAIRELKLGGHEYVRMYHWDTLEVIESAFVE